MNVKGLVHFSIIWQEQVEAAENELLKLKLDPAGMVYEDDFANPDFIYVIHNDESKINDFRKKVNTQYPDFGGLLQQSRMEKVDNIMASVNKV